MISRRGFAFVRSACSRRTIEVERHRSSAIPGG